MIEVVLRFDAQFRRVTECDAQPLKLPEECSLLAALQQAAQHLPDGFSPRLFTEEQVVQPTILLFVNDHLVTSQDAGGHRLNTGDEISLYTPISGG